MSANNQLTIRKVHDVFELRMIDIESGTGGSLEGSFKTFKEAREAAYAFMQENIVEYGLDVADDCYV